MKKKLRYLVPLLITGTITVPWYVDQVIHTNEYSIVFLYKAHIYFSLVITQILLFPIVIILLFEFAWIKKFCSIFYLTICFFALSFLFAIIYQIITCNLPIFYWDKEAVSITKSFYVWVPIIIFFGIFMLIIHFIYLRKRANKPEAFINK